MIHKKLILFYILITIALVSCEPDKVLYKVIPQKAKIIESSFEKEAVFLKWDVKKLKEEKVAAYGISYGIVDGKTLNKREVVPKFMEAEGFTIRKLKEGTQYWFKVQAIYEEFTGPWSEKAEGTTGKPQPPVNFKVKKNTEKTKWYIDVSWENNPLNDERKLNIEEYRVKCWDSNNPTNKYEKTFSSPTKVSTQGVLETSGKVNYVCSVQVKTDKGTLSEVKQSGVLAFDDIEKPAVSKRSESWGTPITVRKVADHSYALKQAISGVAFDESTGQVTATQPAARIIIVAKRAGYAGSVESDPIEFTRQAGNTLRFANANKNTMYATGRNTYTQTAINDRSVRGDTRNIEYSISPMGTGASVDTVSGKVDFTLASIGTTFTITARKAESAKYEAQTASYQLTVAKFKPADKTELQAEITKAVKAEGNNVNLNYIDTSAIADMSELFYNNATFNGDISKWNTSSVTDMSHMFRGARAFNQSLNNWNVSRVTNMYAMFSETTAFNQPLDMWNVSKVINMFGMFFGAKAFNQPLNRWTVSKVTDMGSMFNAATNFNQDIRGWADKSGRNTRYMFHGATAMQKSNKPSWAP